MIRVVESTFNVTKKGHRLIFVTGVLTVTNEDAVKPPSSVVTVIVAEPSARPETFPIALTVAIVVSLELHLTFLLLALEGARDKSSDALLPTPTKRESGVSDKPVKAT
jgi:hypothetical protein